MIYVIGMAVCLGFGLILGFIAGVNLFPVKKEKKQPRKWYIPQENRAEIYALLDKTGFCCHAANFIFWHRISELIPQTKGLELKLNKDEIMNPYVEEAL